MGKKTKATALSEAPKQEDMFLKKHVGLIHCENKLTLVQRKICNILLFNALDAIQARDVHEIYLRQLCGLIGYNSNDSKLIKESIKTLISVVMEWNLLDDTKFLDADNYPQEMISWNASSLLAGASIKNGIIQYSYSPQMKSVLSSSDIYGRINLFVQAKFSSSYSLVLYENCARFKNIQKTAWFPIELFRSLMGVPEGKYPSFKEFRRNVINMAVSEINKKADIHLTPQFKKSGRNIVAVQFEVSDNKNYRPTFKKSARAGAIVTSYQSLSTLLEVLTAEFHFSETQANEITASYPADYILEKVRLIKAKKNIDYPGAYLVSAIKNDYKKTTLPQPVAPKFPIENSYLREAKAASEIQSLKKKYMLYKIKSYTDFVQQQAKEVQQQVKDRFEHYLKPQRELFRSYRKFGLASPFVIAHFIDFIDGHFSNLIGRYLTFDDYITSEEF